MKSCLSSMGSFYPKGNDRMPKELRAFIASCETPDIKGLFKALLEELNGYLAAKECRELHSTDTSMSFEERVAYYNFTIAAKKLSTALKELKVDINKVISLLGQYSVDRKHHLYKKAKAYSELFEAITKQATPEEYMALLQDMPEAYIESLKPKPEIYYKVLIKLLITKFIQSLKIRAVGIEHHSAQPEEILVENTHTPSPSL